MSTAMICCKTIEKELRLAMDNTGVSYPVIWLESGLHNFPEKMRGRLQELIDGAQGFDRLLMGFGFCGNSIAGLKTGGRELVLPRVDDCITLLLGSYTERARHDHTYFLTEGWLAGEQNIWWEYQYTLKKYGKKRGKMIYSMVLNGYKHLGVLDTGAYDIQKLREQTEMIAGELELEHQLLPASVSYLEALLTGPWPKERFLIFPPYCEISSAELTLHK